MANMTCGLICSLTVLPSTGRGPGWGVRRFVLRPFYHDGSWRGLVISLSQRNGIPKRIAEVSLASAREAQGMDLTLDPQAEHLKWLRFDKRLIFTNCGALTWYLRKAWLLDHAPESMPASPAGEGFAIRKAIRIRLAKAEHF